MALATVGALLVPGSLDRHRQRAHVAARPAVIGPSRGQVLAAFEHMLPVGGSVSSIWSDANIQVEAVDQPYAHSSLIYNEGKGAAAFTLNIGWNGQGVRGTGCAMLPPDGPCTTIKEPGLGTLTLVQDANGVNDKGISSKLWGAQLQLPDGKQLTVTESKGSAFPGAFNGPNRVDPPLTLKQLEDAQSPAAQRAELAVLNHLLPKGVTADHATVVDGIAQELLNGGKGGPGLITVQVPLWGWTNGLVWTPRQSGSFKGGTYYSYAFGAGQPGHEPVALMPQLQGVTAVWSSGELVSVTDYSSRSLQSPADRSDPVLTPAQLAAITTSPLWQGLAHA